MVQEDVLLKLGLSPTGNVNILTPSTKGTPAVCMTYDVLVAIYHPTYSLTIGMFPVIASDFTGQPIQGLIGRDLLQKCLLIYDGSNGTFTLGF